MAKEIRDIIIYSASDFSSEVAWTIKEINNSQEFIKWNLIGHIDDKIIEKEGFNILGHKYKNGAIIDVAEIKDKYFIVAIGNPIAKKEVVSMLNTWGVKFATIIHPSVITGTNTSIGEGCYIGAGNIITTNVHIDDHVILNLHCTVGHNTKIGKYSCINPAVNISGGVTIEEGCYIGTNATILQNIIVGGNSVIGAMAMVNRDVKIRTKVMGVPAKTKE